MKLRTSYKKQDGSHFFPPIEIFELPIPCTSEPKIIESIIIDGFKYYVYTSIYRHKNPTHLILKLNPIHNNQLLEQNSTLLAIADTESNLKMEATIDGSDDIQNFKLYSMPKNYKEYVEKDGIVYECISIDLKDKNECSIKLTKHGEFKNHFKSYFSNGLLPNI